MTPASSCTRVQGEWLRSYAPMAQRPQVPDPQADQLGPVPPSSAYVRRVSGTSWQ